MNPTTTEYRYLFQTCGFSIIDDIRAEIESQSDWDFSDGEVEAAQNSRQAARRYGFFEPFTPEQEQLSQILTQSQAGPLIAIYAWGLYSDHLAATIEPAARKQFA